MALDTLTSLYFAWDGSSPHTVIQQNGRVIGSANQRGSRSFFFDSAGRTLGYSERDKEGHVTLYEPGGRTLVRVGR